MTAVQVTHPFAVSISSTNLQIADFHQPNVIFVHVCCRYSYGEPGLSELIKLTKFHLDLYQSLTYFLRYLRHSGYFNENFPYPIPQRKELKAALLLQQTVGTRAMMVVRPFASKRMIQTDKMAYGVQATTHTKSKRLTIFVS